MSDCVKTHISAQVLIVNISFLWYNIVIKKHERWCEQMSRYVEGFNSSQYSFFPISLDDMIDDDNPVRGISAIVDSMDDTSLTFREN